MIIILITTILVCLLVLLVLYRALPNRKIFYAFCVTMLIAVGGIIQSVYFAQSEDTVKDADIRKITAQQQIFDSWYTDYKKQLDILDYNWAQCQMIVNDYRNDNISIHTVYTRMNILSHQAQAVCDNIDKLPPPISLDDPNYDLTTLLFTKTKAYAHAQLTAIQAVRAAADPAAIMTDSHEVQSQLLREALLRNAPDALFTAAETTALRSRLTLPEI